MFHAWGHAGMQMAIALRAPMVLHRRFDAGAVLAAMSHHGCGVLFAVPLMVQRLCELPPGAQRGAELSALRVVATSGSALPGDLAVRFMDLYGDVLYNLYGSTEVSWVSVANPADLRAAPGTAGRPPRGTKVAILDDRGEPVRPGVIGRIFAANEMLFEGYTNGAGREQLDGLMGTGDLGHVDADGRLFVDGREDDMVISGGENVFPREVEDLLARLPHVIEVAVVGVPDREWGQRLAAFVALRPGLRLSEDAVRQHVRENLARFAVPRDVVFVP